jgi:DNA-binding NtrC family response regulator
MLELDGLSVLRAAKKKSAATAVILMTGFGSMDGAIAAIREGAFDNVSKPFKLEQIEAVVGRAAKHWEGLATEAMRRASRFFSKAASSTPRPRVLIGKSPKIVEVYKLVARAALSTSPVLLQGEGGTGKSMVARAIHENSERRTAKLVVWNGTAESSVRELATAVSEARGGTLYIEEVSSLNSSVQLELLHLLEQEDSEVRVIAATPVNLRDAATSGSFRDDLLYQLQVIRIELPPLRERIDDLAELVEAFLVRYSEKNRKNISHVADETLQLFKRYSWPGNVRELQHALERAVIMADSNVLQESDFLFSRKGNDAAEADTLKLNEVERAAVVKAIQLHNGNISKAAEELGLTRASLYRRMEKYGV